MIESSIFTHAPKLYHGRTRTGPSMIAVASCYLLIPSPSGLNKIHTSSSVFDFAPLADQRGVCKSTC